MFHNVFIVNRELIFSTETSMTKDHVLQAEPLSRVLNVFKTSGTSMIKETTSFRRQAP
jgi:hypothetical protein